MGRFCPPGDKTGWEKESLMTRSTTFAAGAALALIVTACEKPADTTANNAVENVDTGTNLAENNVAAVAPLPAAEFGNTIAASDMFEIESGKLAAEKGSSEAIKSFGSTLQTDHTKSTADLKAAAAKAEPAITPAPAMTAEQQGNLDKLNAASGAEFDKLFGEQQVAAHEKALATLQAYSAGGDVPALREFATKAATVVQGHLDKAHGLGH
jgi:putative membrane protein